MPDLNIDVTDYNLAPIYGRQIIVGSAFAFIMPTQTNDALQIGLNNFYGGTKVLQPRTLSLLPDGQILPGFNIKPATNPFKLTPLLLSDKEIYRAGKDPVRLVAIAPSWVLPANSDRSSPQITQLVIENNGIIYRQMSIELATGGMTLVDLGVLPEGNYRIYWDGDEAVDSQGNKTECCFSIVEYVLSPLQVNLVEYRIRESALICHLKIDRFNQPLNQQVQLQLWSGNQKVGQYKFKPVTPGIYKGLFRLKSNTIEKLELRINYLDEVATVLIAGSEKSERELTLISRLGKNVEVSLMPRDRTRGIRGLYLSEDEDSTVQNTPVAIADIAPNNHQAQLCWQVAASSARLLLLDMGGKVIEDRDLGEVVAGQIIDIKVPTPGGFLAIGGWIENKAWEGWSILLAPSNINLDITTPLTAKPGEEIELKLATESLASVYILVRDRRLSGASPQEKLAALLKKGIKNAAGWGTLGYLYQTLEYHPNWPNLTLQNYSFGGVGFSDLYEDVNYLNTSPTAALMMASAPAMAMEPELQEDLEDVKINQPRRDFADVAYCNIVQTDVNGEASLSFKLPDAIASYTIEAFALSQSRADWCSKKESLAVSKLIWGEFKLPVFIYPGDRSPATLDINCTSGYFRLKLLCDNVPVPFTLTGATQTAAENFMGERAQVTFAAYPGEWRAELEDLTTGDRDITERIVTPLGYFKGLAQRFRFLTAGQTISRNAPIVQIRLIPSLKTSFNILCDATADYSHHCCEQTAAKLIAAVASLVAGGDRPKLRDVILAGVAREKLMHIPGQGLMMYPPQEWGGERKPDEYWGKLAAEHLSSLGLLGLSLFTAVSTEIDEEIQQALNEAIAIGEDAAAAYKLPLIPNKINNGRDAYRAIIKQSHLWDEALGYARHSLNRDLAFQQGAVLAREEQAYCAAALLIGGERSDLNLAIVATNNLANNIGVDGRLYSTVDSVALISLMTALGTADINFGGTVRIKLDGRELALAEALESTNLAQFNHLEVLQGSVLVELTTEIIEDWNVFQAKLPVRVKLNRTNNWTFGSFHLGENVELAISVDYYEPGMLAHICLPPSLSRLQGGGEVKRFSVDFCGHTEVRIPLRISGYTLPAGEHWSLLVRNMFNEEKVGNPGPLQIHVNGG